MARGACARASGQKREQAAVLAAQQRSQGARGGAAKFHRGPSGPREAPLPSVMAAANALSTGDPLYAAAPVAHNGALPVSCVET